MARRFSRRPSAEWRVVFLGFLMLCSLSVLVAKLWYEQVLRGAQWTRKIAGKSEVTVRIPSMRGEIRDRNGITLVTNRASYEVDFYLPDMVRGYRSQYGAVPLVPFQAAKGIETLRGGQSGPRLDRLRNYIRSRLSHSIRPSLSTHCFIPQARQDRVCATAFELLYRPQSMRSNGPIPSLPNPA